MRTALTIAGSDSGGGAGLQADLKTFSAFGVYGMSAVTAITAQNTTTVAAVEPVSPALVVAQIDAVAADLPIHAVKIGMLAETAIVIAVAEALARLRLDNIVLDTVMVSKGGVRLIAEDAVEALKTRLLPLATVATPNVPEAEVLSGLRIASLHDQRLAAERIVALGARAVVVKGGHLAGPATDVFFDGAHWREFTAPRVDTRHTHGTGCTFSAAIAAGLARGDDLVTAVDRAKDYVTGAIAHAPGFGHGHGPVAHFWRLY